MPVITQDQPRRRGSRWLWLLLLLSIPMFGAIIAPFGRPQTLQIGPWMVTVWARWRPEIDLGPQGVFQHTFAPKAAVSTFRVPQLGALRIVGPSYKVGLTLGLGQYN